MRERGESQRAYPKSIEGSKKLRFVFDEGVGAFAAFYRDVADVEPDIKKIKDTSRVVAAAAILKASSKKETETIPYWLNTMENEVSARGLVSEVDRDIAASYIDASEAKIMTVSNPEEEKRQLKSIYDNMPRNPVEKIIYGVKEKICKTENQQK